MKWIWIGAVAYAALCACAIGVGMADAVARLAASTDGTVGEGWGGPPGEQILGWTAFAALYLVAWAAAPLAVIVWSMVHWRMGALGAFAIASLGGPVGTLLLARLTSSSDPIPYIGIHVLGLWLLLGCILATARTRSRHPLDRLMIG